MPSRRNQHRGGSARRSGNAKGNSGNGSGHDGNGGNGGNGSNGSGTGGSLSPQQIAVILALLSNSLFVQSLLVDKDQTIQIVLQGSLKRKRRIDKLLDELSGMSMGDVLDSLKDRL
jgi:hypothetical protein